MPSGAATIASGLAFSLGSANSFVSTPAVVMRPILFVLPSPNQSAPSAPATIGPGSESAVGSVNSVMTPAVVIRPTLFAPDSVNHSAPSGPAVMLATKAFAVGSGYSVTVPSTPSRPIASPRDSANHSAPSEPSTMSLGNAPGVTGYDVCEPSRPSLTIDDWSRLETHSAPWAEAMPVAPPPTSKERTRPVSVMRNTRPRLESAVYIAPSGPATMSPGTANSARSGISVTRGEACAAEVAEKTSAAAAIAAAPDLVAESITPGCAPPGRRASGESLVVPYGAVVLSVKVSVLP